MISPIIGEIWHKIRKPWDIDQSKRGMKEGEVYGLSKRQINKLLDRTGFTLLKTKRFMCYLNTLYIFRKSGNE